MIRPLLLLVFLSCLFACSAAHNDDIWPDTESIALNEEKHEGFICIIIETQAEYPGGTRAWNDYLEKHIRHSLSDKETNEGSVFLSFIVETDGALSDIQVIRGVHESLDKEAVRLLKQSKPWIPGKRLGKDISSHITLRMKFKSHNQIKTDI